MRVSSPRFVPAALVTLALATSFALWLCFEAGWNVPRLGASPSSYGRSTERSLVRQMLLHEHNFIPASDDNFYYGGRWTFRRNRTGRDTGVPGAYIEFIVTNSSSIYLNLYDSVSSAPLVERAESNNVPVGEHDPAAVAASVSLVAQLTHHDPVHFDKTAHGTLRIATGLDRAKYHTVRVTLLHHVGIAYTSTIAFEGVWLSKGGLLSSTQRTSAHFAPALPPLRPHIEMLSALSFCSPTDATSAYSVLMASALDVSISQVPIADQCLTDVCPENGPSIQDTFFHEGRPQEGQFWSSQQLVTSPHAAIVLSLGLLDFQHLLEKDPSDQEVARFIENFIQTYAEFVTTIRLVHWGDALPERWHERSTLHRGASYIYNSAPSTTPIFVFTPFTSSRHLRRLLGHATSAVVRNLRAEGDLSIIWIDTNGWLSQSDFRSPANATDQHAFEDLTLSGHARAAAHLSVHFCPYFREDCPYDKHDIFGGNLYAPAEAGMGKLVEERKVNLIEEFLNLS